MRSLIEILADSFSKCLDRSARLLDSTPEADLYRRPRELPTTFVPFTIGQYLLRSGATIEQTFNGITTRLWDDPFEWTLPEKLHNKALVLEYLSEVRRTVSTGISFIDNDDALAREIPAPTEIMQISNICLIALTRAEHYQGRAFAVFQMLSDDKLPKIDI